jgi:4a-hydroxytetrahydrobiopterin dehydratase
MQRISDDDLKKALPELSGWSLEGGELVRTFSFGDFRQAMQFVNQVADLAEDAGHHPDIDIRYNRVRLALVTHDAGGITSNDTSMAKGISGLAK